MKYFAELNKALSEMEVSQSNGKSISLDNALSKITKLIKKCKTGNNKIILVGNGGSASIASHIATDFLKNANVAALCFNDSSLLTCLSNDLGYEQVFKKPISMLAQKGDIVFTISSSGKSENILNAAFKARDKKCFLVTLSGFKKDNPLRSIGDLNFYIPSNSYGYVEIAHLTICHHIVDMLTEK